jgi:hypothetical protein
LLKVADAVIEVLIQQKTVTVPGITSNQTVTIPDIEATAINLKDSRILGQAASSDITGHVPAASLGSYDVREIAEVTALSLMEDMIPQAK